MKKCWTLACIAGFVLLIFSGLLAAVWTVGTDAELYYALQTEAGVVYTSGITDSELLRLDYALADCLKGDADALTGLEATVFGQRQPAFNERELIHMEDCRKLFGLLRRTLSWMLPLGLLLTAAGGFGLRDGKRFRRCAWLAIPVLLVPLGLFASWAALDFNAAFHFFHKILFTNDLWLLDPRTDLLIRICPASMFMKMGLRIVGAALSWMLILPTAVTVVTRLKKERI